MKRKKRIEVADLYPTHEARLKADAVIEDLDDELPMNEYIRQWDLAYRAAGGELRLPKGQRKP